MMRGSLHLTPDWFPDDLHIPGSPYHAGGQNKHVVLMSNKETHPPKCEALLVYIKQYKVTERAPSYR